jgi:hypothetical protein
MTCGLCKDDLSRLLGALGEFVVPSKEEEAVFIEAATPACTPPAAYCVGVPGLKTFFGLPEDGPRDVNGHHVGWTADMVPDLRWSIKKFQEHNNLSPVSGFVDRATALKLNEAITAWRARAGISTPAVAPTTYVADQNYAIVAPSTLEENANEIGVTTAGMFDFLSLPNLKGVGGFILAVGIGVGAAFILTTLSSDIEG